MHIFTWIHLHSSNGMPYIHSLILVQHTYIFSYSFGKPRQTLHALSQLRPCLTHFLPRKPFLSLFVFKFIRILVNKWMITILVIRVTFTKHSNALILSDDISLINWVIRENGDRATATLSYTFITWLKICGV